MELDRKLLGKGKFGKVFEVENERGERIALKIVHPRNFNLIEIDVLSRMKSPYLIRSMGEIEYFPGEGEGMTMELKENNLSKFNLQQTSSGQIKRIIISLMLGIECLHKKGFLHLDVKPGNCLYDVVDGNYTGYISDFGHSIRCRDAYLGVTRETRAGSLKYFPYEILEKKDNYLFDDKSDVWSLGVTILVFLGMNYKFEFKFGDTNDYKTQMIKKYWDDEPIENIIRYNVNNLNFLEEDKIDLTEMLIHMTKKDRDERLSSRDFKELRFYQKNILPNECILSSPREILYIPYSSSNVIRGIKSLNSYFETKHTGFRLDTYFLCIELFIRMMQVSPLEISDQTLEEIIQYCFIGSLKYYKETKESAPDISFSENSVYKLSKLLNNDIAPNRFFYKAKYLDDLVLLKEIVFQNYYLISMYSYLNVERVFEYFRQNYDYSGTEIKEKMRFSDMMKSTIPTKNKDTHIENDRSIFSSRDLESDTKLVKEDVSYIKKMNTVEEKFNNILLGKMKNMGIRRSNNFKGDIRNYYRDNIKEKNISMSVTMTDKNIINFLYIEEDIFNNIQSRGKEFSNHFLFKNMEDQFSLLFKDDVERRVTHYSSKFNKNLYEFFKKKLPGYNYFVDYKKSSDNICKVPEACLLFLIEYNRVTSTNGFKYLFVSDETIKNMIDFCSVH